MNNKYVMIMVALLAVLTMIMPVSAEKVIVGTQVTQGATVFLGEEGLNITSAMDTYDTLGYWSAGADLSSTSPLVTIPVTGRMRTFSISESEFGGYMGGWYRVDSGGSPHGVAFTVQDPKISVSLRNNVTDANVGGNTVTAGTGVAFKVETNIILNNKRGDISSEMYAPVADFAVTVNPSNGIVTFTPVISGGAATNYEWVFSDVVETVTTQTATHAYESSYDATLTVYNTVNSAGTHSSMKKTITVSLPTTYSGTVTVGSPSTPNPSTDPYASFSGVVSNTGYVVLSGFSTGATTWNWDLGDGNVSTDQNPAPYRYSPITGTHTVSLSVTDGSTTTPSVVSGTVIVSATQYAVGTSGNVAFSPDPASITTTSLDTTKGYINIVVKSEGGTTYSQLQSTSGDSISLKNQFPTSSPFYWTGGAWNTGAIDGNNARIYSNGIYTVYAESTLNGMLDNYKSGGAFYTGKTVSTTQTVTLGGDNIQLDINRASVVRGKSFAITLVGQPSSDYKLWIKGLTSSSSAPQMTLYQEGVNRINGTYAVVTTSSSGSRVIEFTTASTTKEEKYTIRAESVANNQKYDEVTISVVKGGLTLVAEGDQSYYLGEEITLSGTNTETDVIYFFVVGPNLYSNGANLRDPSIDITNGVEGTFESEVIDADDTFTYKWQTAGVDLDAGTYTIYGVSLPVDKSHLTNDVSYATTSVIIRKPYVSASISQPSIAKGDRVYVEGIAEGTPNGVAVWILGKNYATRNIQSIDSDGTYKYELSYATTADMASGQYFIVVQHPMQNDRFDIDVNGDYVYNVALGDGTSIFKLLGSGSLQGSDAAEALIRALDNPNIDDTYTKLNVIVSEPLIAIDPIGDKHVGDKFTISGKTNLAADDEILIEVYSSSFKPTEKSQSGEFSGTTGNVKVVKPNGTTGLNAFSFDIDSSTFKVDEYIVVAQGIIQDATGTALFNVVTGASTPEPTVAPSVVVTAPVSVVTAIPTVPPTEVPTTIEPTPTPTTPGFGAVFALMGLMGVAFIVVRRQ